MIIAIYSEKTRPVRCLSASKLTVHTKKRKKKKKERKLWARLLACSQSDEHSRVFVRAISQVRLCTKFEFVADRFESQARSRDFDVLHARIRRDVNAATHLPFLHYVPSTNLFSFLQRTRGQNA